MQKCIGVIQPNLTQEPFLCDPNTKNRNAFTPLLVAAKENHFEVMDILLGAGADPNSQDPLSGMTPLHLVVCKYHTQRRLPTCQVTFLFFNAIYCNILISGHLEPDGCWSRPTSGECWRRGSGSHCRPDPRHPDDGLLPRLPQQGGHEHQGD